MIRTVFRAVDVPGEGSAHVRVTYPADAATLDEARLTGLLAASPGAPRPVVIVLPGINVPPDAYVGLANGDRFRPQQGPVLIPDGGSLEWYFAYDPAPADRLAVL